MLRLKRRLSDCDWKADVSIKLYEHLGLVSTRFSLKAMDDAVDLAGKPNLVSATKALDPIPLARKCFERGRNAELGTLTVWAAGLSVLQKNCYRHIWGPPERPY